MPIQYLLYYLRDFQCFPAIRKRSFCNSVFTKQYWREHSKYTSLAEESKWWHKSTLEKHITHYYAHDLVQVVFGALACIEENPLKEISVLAGERPCTKCLVNHIYLNFSILAYSYSVPSFSENGRHTRHIVRQYYKIRFSNLFEPACSTLVEWYYFM